MAAIDQLIAQGGGQQFDPLATVGRVTQLQNLRLQGQAAQTQNQTAQLENQQRQQDFSDQQHLRSLYNGLQPGQIPSDDDILKAAGPKLGMAIVTQHRQMLKAQADLQDTQGKVAAGEQEYVANLGRAIQQANYEPNTTHTILSLAGTVPGYGQHVQALAQMYDQNPGQFKQVIDSAVAASPKQATAAKDKAQEDLANAQIPGAQAKAQQEQRANFASQLAATGSQQAYDAARGQLPFAVASQFPAKYDHDAVLQAGMTPHEQATVPVEMQAAKAWLAKNPGKTMADFNEYNKKLVPAYTFNLQSQGGNTIGKPAADVAKSLGVTPQALDQSAEKYFSTGTIQSMGRGPMTAAYNKAVMNRAAELHPDGSLAANSAEFKANADSLKSLQKQFDAVSAFESTANKNINVLKGTLQNIPDLGTRFANTPARMISDKLIGTEGMARYKTALATVQSESAKILNSANASGVLSDSARHELQDMVDGNATIPAMLGSLQTLQQDFGNRHQSYADQISDIQGRLRNSKGGNVAGGGTATATGAITVTDPRGVVHTFKDQASADNFKKLAGIK